MIDGARRCLAAIATATLLATQPALAEAPKFGICAPYERRTARTVCVWDGDTVVLFGERVRLEEIDAPERSEPQCHAESDQAMAATYRLQAILNEHPWELIRSGKDSWERTLGRFVIGETTAGAMLVEEGYARPWEGRRRGWC